MDYVVASLSSNFYFILIQSVKCIILLLYNPVIRIVFSVFLSFFFYLCGNIQYVFSTINFHIFTNIYSLLKGNMLDWFDYDMLCVTQDDVKRIKSGSLINMTNIPQFLNFHNLFRLLAKIEIKTLRKPDYKTKTNISYSQLSFFIVRKR